MSRNAWKWVIVVLFTADIAVFAHAYHEKPSGFLLLMIGLFVVLGARVVTAMRQEPTK